MRRLLTIVLVALSLFGSGAAFAQSAPAEVVANIYREAVRLEKANLASYRDAQLQRRYFTASFRAVAKTIDAREVAANFPILDYDPIWPTGVPLTDLVIKTEREDATRARVVARFGVGKERTSVIYDMAKEAGEWRVDDITAVYDPDINKDPLSVRRVLAQDLAAGAKKQ